MRCVIVRSNHPVVGWEILCFFTSLSLIVDARHRTTPHRTFSTCLFVCVCRDFTREKCNRDLFPQLKRRSCLSFTTLSSLFFSAGSCYRHSSFSFYCFVESSRELTEGREQGEEEDEEDRIQEIIKVLTFVSFPSLFFFYEAIFYRDPLGVSLVFFFFFCLFSLSAQSWTRNDFRIIKAAIQCTFFFSFFSLP